MVLNPVERRLVELCAHWDAFRLDASKRLMIWQVPDSALRIFQCFFAAQKYDSEYTTGDLFVVFDTPFENSIQYSRALKESLAGQYEASRDDLNQQGIAPEWQYNPQQYTDSASGFLQSLRSFGSQHHTSIGHLVAVLMPSSVTDDDAFASWLNRSLATRIPEHLRLCVTDSLETPRLQQLASAGDELVYVDAPAIDALTTAQETFAQEAAAGPAGVFRNYLIGLMTLVEKGSAEQVKTKAADAIAFARKQQWLDQEVVVTTLVAGSLLNEKRCDEAVTYYQHARKVATQAIAAEHPAGKELVLQSWFGEAGARLASGDDAKAADCYDEAAIIAQQIPNHILSIEAFRMSAFCHARLENHEAAKERGLMALTIGERNLKPEARLMTTLPIAAVDLLRIADPERVTSIEHIKHEQEIQISKAHEDAEQRASQLEQTKDPKLLHDIEETLALETATYEQQANEQLNATVSAGDDQFRNIFIKARKLLGEQWPLAIPSAIPGMPEAEEEAAA